MSESRTVRAKRNLLFGMINKIVSLLLPFISRSFFVTLLGAEYLGLNSLFTSILQMLNLAELGFSSAVVFSMYKPIAVNDNKAVCALLNLYKKVYRIIGIVILSIGLCLLPFLDRLTSGEIPEDTSIYILYLLFLGNTVLSYLLFAYKRSVLEASQRNDIVTSINTGVLLAQNVIQIVLLVVYRNYYIYLIIMLVCTIANNLIVAYITSRLYPHYVCAGSINDETLKDLKYKISGLMISKICSTTRNSLDSIIISTFVGLVPVAIYGNYYYIMSGVHGILSVVTTAIAASVGNSIVTETPEKNYKDMMKFMLIYSWIAGVCVNCLLNLYQPFMELWMGKDMLFPNYIVGAICVYFYSLTMGDIRSIYMTGAGLWWEGRYRSVMETVMNLILNIVLGKYFGVMGVVLATIVSILMINFGYGSHIVFKYYFKNGKTFLYFKQHMYCVFIVLLSCVVTFTLCDKINCTGILALVVNLIISVLISSVLFLLFASKLPVFNEAKAFVFRMFAKAQ